MSILSFLLHTIKHLASFLLGSLIHSRFRYFLLESSDIRYILWVHFIQLTLKYFYLFLYSILSINAFVSSLLLQLSAFCNICHFHKLIRAMLYQIKSLSFTISFHYGKLFFPSNAEISRHRAGQFIYIFPLKYEASSPESPLIVLNELQEFRTKSLKTFILLLLVHILYLRQSNYL